MYRDSQNNSVILYEKHIVKSIHIVYVYMHNTFSVDTRYLELRITKEEIELAHSKKN